MAAAADEGICTFVNGRDEKLRRWCLPNVSSPKAICVLVHGVGDHILAYQHVAEVFWEKHRISVCGFDQVGHGMSEGARVDIRDFQHYVDDLIQYIDLIKSENPGLQIFAIGYSMGGLVLGHALLHKPDIVDGVIMYAAAVNAEIATTLKVTMAKLLSPIFPSFPLHGPGDEALTRNTEELERLKSDTLRRQGGLKLRWAHHFLNALVDFKPKMSEITTPMFIVHGTDDKICHIDGSTTLRDTVSSSDKTFKAYEKCLHRIHTEPDGQGDQLIGDICEWINSRIKPE